MKIPFSTGEACAAAGLTESNLRHWLRRPGAPRPPLHPTAHVFLWDEASVRALVAFVQSQRALRKEAADAP